MRFHLTCKFRADTVSSYDIPSALPTLETHPLSAYSRDGWNLNNLPILPGSLLRYIKSDISGMTVPWIYVGMMFSTFCWHNEDHYTYSVNYQHWGDTKTWYGVPGGDAEKFEDAMRKAAPDLFETSPDLLFQLVTMMSPAKLKKEGVRVYACDQRANEFVITYPKAYHSGFNQGFNLNEAVNFALPDWIFQGLECVRRYQKFSKFPVFSHDELVITVSQHNQTVSTAIWLQHAMKEMVDREIGKRKALREAYPDIQQVIEDRDLPEPDYQCSHCNVFCYLSQVICESSPTTACLDHAALVCAQDASTKWTLRMHFSDEQLQNGYAKVAERAAIPFNWQQRLHKLLINNPRPPLRSLRGLLNEGERIPYRLPEVDQLRDFVEKANEWVETATLFITRRHHKRRADATPGRKRKSIGDELDNGSPTPRSEPADDAASDAGAGRSPDAVFSLLAEAESLPFDSPEIASLRSVVEQMDEFNRQAADVLQRSAEDQASLDECEQVLGVGTSLNIDLDRLDELGQYVARRKWVAEMDDIHANFISFSEVEELLDEASKCGIPADHPYRIDLGRRRELGKEWMARAKGILDGPSLIDPVALEELTQAPNEVAIVPELHLRAESLLNKSKDWSRTVKSILTESETDPNADETSDARPRAALLADARRLLRSVASAKLRIPLLHILQDAVDRHDRWTQDLGDLIVGTFKRGKLLNANQVHQEIESFCSQVHATADTADEMPPQTSQEPHRRHCVCRAMQEPHLPSEENARCADCDVVYHLSCLKLDRRDLGRNFGQWSCPICVPSKLPTLLSQRQAVQLEKIAVLAESPQFQPHRFRFPPAELAIVRSAFGKASRLAKLARDFLAPNPTPKYKPHDYMFRHLLRKSIACPVDIGVSASSTVVSAISQVLFNLHGLDAQGKEIKQAVRYGSEVEGGFERGTASPSMSTPSGTAAAANANRDERKRKRGKRAKFVFQEEVGIFVPVDGERIYCLCHKAETGTMISCDRCTLWYHNTCVHVDNTSDLGEEKWICPMCCVKTERKYPFAEVKVKEMGEFCVL